MGPVTRQDVQNIIETARNRIMERMVTRQDISVLNETIRQLANIQQQNQQLLKQSEYQRLQLNRRAVALEARLATLENETRNMAIAMNKMAGQKAQPIIIPVPQQNNPEIEPGMARQYGYQPT
jgi:hypothetical protein